MRQDYSFVSLSGFVSLSLPILVVLGLGVGCSGNSNGEKNEAAVGGTAGSMGTGGSKGTSGGTSSIDGSGGSSTGNSTGSSGGSSTGSTSSGGSSTSTSGGSSTSSGGSSTSTSGGSSTSTTGGSSTSSGGSSTSTSGGSSASTSGGSSASTSGGSSTSTSGGNSTSTSGGNSSIGGTTGAAGAQQGVRWVGRVQPIDANSARFAWQGAGVIATVSGSTIAVKLRTEDTDTVYFQPVIDHNVLARINVDKGADRTISLATGLSGGDHLVELYRETEGYYGMSTFLGFTTGTVKGAPASDGRLLEVVGDSISAGYGDLGSEPHPNWVATPACHWTAENSSWYATYAAVAGHALGVEVSTIARSGAGMVRDLSNDANNVVPKVYANALGMSNTTSWAFTPKASAVVINLGTNDWANGDPGASYETAYVQFIATVRSNYPSAWIFLVIGSMLNDTQVAQVNARLAKVVSTVQTNTGDTKLATFDLGVQSLGANGEIPSGCDWHPSVTEHARMAGILQAKLTEKLGW